MSSNTTSAQTISGRYHLLTILGEGGMGAVYKAYDRLQQQHVALKRVFVSPTIGNFDVRLALAQEFQVLASLRHPHIISVLDYGFDETQQPYFTMTLLDDAQTLRDAAQHQTLPLKMTLVMQILQALLYLHRRHILHRDLKPANILVKEAQAKVLDFGLAIAKADVNIANGDAIVGTAGYIAPEVLTGEAITEASDLYAVGIMMYELIAGRHPFEINDFMRLLYAPLTHTPNFDALEDTPPPTPAHPEIETRTFSPDDRLPPGTDGVTRTLDTEIDLSTHDTPPPSTPSHTQIFPISDPPIADPSVSPAPQRPTTLAQIVRKLLAREVEARYQSAHAVIDDLQAVLGESQAAENRSTLESFLQAARFVGREKEIAQLEQALQDVLQRNGQLWYITGESGVGKSRLLDEIRIRALVRGALVMRGQATPHGGPYHLWREPLRRLALHQTLSDADASVLKVVVSDLDELLERPVSSLPPIDAEDFQKRLLAMLHSILQTQQQPLVLLLEDLHWAGEESVAIIQYLQQNIANLPLLIIGSYRDDEHVTLPTVGHMLHLQRFTKQEVADLSAAMLGDTANKKDIRNLLHKQTEGNAFFLVEVIRALAEEAGQLNKIGSIKLPESVFTQGVYEVVQRRLARLPADDLPLLRVAAVTGRELDLDILRHITPTVDDWLYRCADANILEIQDERWQFSHDKLRQGVLGHLFPLEKEILHRQVAQIMETLYAERPEHAAALAYHWGEARNPHKHLRYSLKAGEYAHLTSDNTQALVHFETALTLLAALKPKDQAAQAAKVHLMVAQAALRLGRGEDALAAVQKSLDHAKNSSLKANAICFRGQIHNRQGEYPSAVADLTQALKMFRRLNDQVGIALALSGLGQAYMYQGQAKDAQTALQDSLTISRELKNTYKMAFALSNLGALALSSGEFEAAAAALEEGRSLYQQAGDRNGMAGTLLHLGMLAHMQDQLDAAMTYYQQSEQHFTEIGDLHGLSASLNNQGAVALARLQLREAAPYFERSLQISRDIHDQWGTANTLSNLAQVELDLEAHMQAHVYLHEALTIAYAQHATPLVLEILFGFGRLWAAQERIREAYTLLSAVSRHEATGLDIQEKAEALCATLRGDYAAEITVLNPPTLDLETMVQTVLHGHDPKSN